MFKLTNAEIETVDMKKARKILDEYNTFNEQRNYKPRHSDDLAEYMNKGVFLLGNISFAFFEKKIYLVNGQHQLNAILKSEKPTLCTVTTYDCESFDDVSLLYRQFDNHKGRTASDCLKMENAALNISWPVSLSNLILSGIVVADGLNLSNKNEKIELLSSHTVDGKFVSEIFTLPKGMTAPTVKFLKNQYVVAAMIKTARSDYKKAYVFWKDVRDGANLSPDSPALALRNYLAPIIKRDKDVNRRILCKSITAWNAWKQGKTTALKYYEDKPIPEVM